MGHDSIVSGTESGIKVIDRAVSILLAVAEQPRSLAELAAATDLPRATAHRLAAALETHHLLRRNPAGHWTIGTVLTTLGAAHTTTLINAAIPLMDDLVTTTGESVQLYQLAGTTRVCVAAREPAAGLHNTVPVGTRLPLTAGSAAKIFLAYASPSLIDNVTEHGAQLDCNDIEKVRTQGWSESVSEREVGLASLSAPILNADGQLVAALSISGPAQRLSPSPGALWAAHLSAAATSLSQSL